MPRKSSRDEAQTISCPSKMRQLNIRIPLEALELLQQFAPTRKSWGATVAQLLYDERARREERQLRALRERSPTAVYNANHRQN